MKLPVLFMLMFAFSGCASMTVSVSILDSRFWTSPEYLSSAISNQVTNVQRDRGSGKFAQAQETIKSQAHQALTQLATACTSIGGHPGCVDVNDVERLYKSIAIHVDKAFDQADEHFNAAFTKLVKASVLPPPDNYFAILFEAQGDLVSGFTSIRTIQDAVSTDLRKYISSVAPAAQQPAEKLAIKDAKQAVADTQEAAAGLIGNNGILNDPLASSVVYAPEPYWQRPDSNLSTRNGPYGNVSSIFTPSSAFNETFASGNFGNTDIAVKMESIGNFTIKGVRLDASKITQATFAVGRQAIKTVAAIYGIPLPSGNINNATPPASITTLSGTSIGFESPDRRLAKAEEALLRSRLARLTIMETILLQKDALTKKAGAADAAATEVARATALKTVKDVFDANRAELETTSAN